MTVENTQGVSVESTQRVLTHTEMGDPLDEICGGTTVTIPKQPITVKPPPTATNKKEKKKKKSTKKVQSSAERTPQARSKSRVKAASKKTACPFNAKHFARKVGWMVG